MLALSFLTYFELYYNNYVLTLWSHTFLHHFKHWVVNTLMDHAVLAASL